MINLSQMNAEQIRAYREERGITDASYDYIFMALNPKMYRHIVVAPPEREVEPLQPSIAEKKRTPDSHLKAMRAFLKTYLEEWRSTEGGRHIPLVIQTLADFLPAFEDLYSTHRADIDTAIADHVQQIQAEALQRQTEKPLAPSVWRRPAPRALRHWGLTTKASIREALEQQHLSLHAGKVLYKGQGEWSFGKKTFQALVAWAYNDNESDDEPGLKQREPSERNKAIAALRAKGLTYKAIGQQYGISGARVREILQAMQPTHGNGQGK